MQAGYTDFTYLRDIWRKTTEEEALLGVSMTGVASGNVMRYDLSEAARCVRKENARVAAKIGIRPAARTTCIKPAGTTSLVLGTSSGIHPWHAPFYIRRLRMPKHESLAKYLQQQVPQLLEADKFQEDALVLCVPQQAPQGAIVRSESALQLLERIKLMHATWISAGHVSGINSHNVSATVSLKEGEWDAAAQWMWQNREHYNGLTILPYDMGSYVQAPFEECSEETYHRMCKLLHTVDLSNVIETMDFTDFSQAAACAGNACEL